METYDRLPDKEFWTEKNFEYWFERNSSFGVKIWRGLFEILDDKLKRDTPEYQEFDRLTEILNLASSSVEAKTWAAIQSREWVSKTFGISLE